MLRLLSVSKSLFGARDPHPPGFSAPRVLRFRPERALYPFCRPELAAAHNIPQFSAWIHNIRGRGGGESIWDGPGLFARYATARQLTGRDRSPADSVLVVRDLEINGARLFGMHPKMDVGKFIFRNVVFNRCLFVEDCFCGIAFYSCQFNDCIFMMPGWQEAVGRQCLRRCRYVQPVLLVRKNSNVQAQCAEFVRTINVAGGQGQGRAQVRATLAQAIAALPPGPPLLYDANTPVKGWQ